jgi:hypothetical protein
VATLRKPQAHFLKYGLHDCIFHPHKWKLPGKLPGVNTQNYPLISGQIAQTRGLCIIREILRKWVFQARIQNFQREAAQMHSDVRKWTLTRPIHTVSTHNYTPKVARVIKTQGSPAAIWPPAQLLHTSLFASFSQPKFAKISCSIILQNNYI